MDKKLILDDALNGMNTADFIACLIWAFIGIIASFLIEIIRHRKVIKDNGGFSIKVWFVDNIARALLSIIAVVAGILFAPEFLAIDKGIKGAFLAGLVTDKLVEALIKLKDNININALWTKKQ